MDLLSVRAFAAKQLEKAKDYSRTIKFAEERQRKSITANRSQEIRASIADDPELASLNIGDGIGAWASIASVDLRRSTALADSLGPRNTYLMTHVLLPTLAYVCEHMHGMVMNFRGDGLFASFGLQKLRSDESQRPDKSYIHTANMHAVVCGLALVEATKDAVEPVLSKENIEVDLSVGVGVDCGSVVVTRVGWMNAQELTAYGSPVNYACKLSDQVNQVRVSDRVASDYPSSPEGTMRFADMGDGCTASSASKMLFQSRRI